MKLCWSTNAWNDYLFWQKNDKKKLARINTLIKETMKSPFGGIGNPEPLKHDLKGFWSKRIDKEHRLVYAYSDEELFILACRYHY